MSLVFCGFRLRWLVHTALGVLQHRVLQHRLLPVATGRIFDTGALTRLSYSFRLQFSPLHMQFCRRLESRPSLLFSIHPGLKDSFLHLIGRSNILLPNFCPRHWSSVPHLPTLEHKNREDHFKFYFLPRQKLSLGGQLAGHWENRKHGTAEWEVLHHLAARASYLLVA